MEGSEQGGHSGKPEPRMILKITPSGFQFYSLSFKGRPIGAAEAVASRAQLDDDQCNQNNTDASNPQITVAAENLNGLGLLCGGTEPECSVCSKTFHSEKALHGHMRCHPERDWRGAYPPLYSSAAKATDSSSSSSMTSTVVSFDIPPPQPPLIRSKTGRRGQNRTINSTSPCTISSLHKERMRMEENHLRDYPSKKLKINNRDTLMFGGQDDAGNNCSQEFLETRKYKCKTCHKVFPTLQDLIGNKSNDSYKETPAMGNRMYASSSRTRAPEEEGVPLVSTSRHVKRVEVVQKSHKCKICNKTFPTGQALGGHQTIHRPKLAQPEPAAPQQEPVLMLTFHEEAKQSDGPRVMDFDLNELPPVEEEEQLQNLCSIVHPFP